jgi:serine/threonine-protein kinase RsbW
MNHFSTDIIAEPNAISALTERAAGFLGDLGVDVRAAHHVSLVLDEILTNVATHGGAQGTSASVRLEVAADRVMVEVVDGGAMFDPRNAPDVDLSSSLGERPIGGLGLLLVHRVTEGLAYERIEDRNRTTFWVKRAPVNRPDGG